MNEHYLVAYYEIGNGFYSASLIEPSGKTPAIRMGIEGLEILANNVVELMGQVSLDAPIAPINMIPEKEKGFRLSKSDNKKLCGLITKRL